MRPNLLESLKQQGIKPDAPLQSSNPLIDHLQKSGIKKTEYGSGEERVFENKPTAQENKEAYVNKLLEELDFSDGYNDDEKNYLRQIARNPNVKGDEFRDAMATVSGNHKDQGGYQTWYKDLKTGMPVPLKPGQKAPEGSRVESIWGSQASAEDDSIGTTIGKNLANLIPQFIDMIGDVGATAQTLVTGKEPEWYKAQKVRLEAWEGVTSSKSQEEMFDTKGIDSFSDLLDSKRYNFTPDNIAGTISSGVSSILQFMGANALTGGMATAAKGASFGAKAVLKGKQALASVAMNLGESLDAAEEAGLTGREKFAVSVLKTLPVAAVEMNLGLTGKLLGNTTAQAEKSLISKSVGSLIKKDAMGNITKESLNKAYKESMIQATSFGKRWAGKVLEEGASEATEEMAQGFLQDATSQIYDKLFAEGKDVGQGKFGADALSAESFAKRINEGLAGFGPGALGAGVKNEKQSMSAYDAVASGQTSALKAELEGALKAEKISQEDYELAVQKIDSYATYHKELEGMDLEPKTKKRVGDLAFTNENLKVQIQELEKNPKAKEEGSIPAINLATRKDLLAQNTKEIKELMTKPIAEEQTAMAQKTQSDIDTKTKSEGTAEIKTATPKKEAPKKSTLDSFFSKKKTEEVEKNREENLDYDKTKYNSGLQQYFKKDIDTETKVSDKFQEAASKLDEGVSELTKSLPEEEIPLDKIIPTQKGINTDRLNQSEKSDELPVVIKKGEDYYIEDGHHRIINSIIKGDKIKAKVFDETVIKEESKTEELPADVKEQEAKMDDIALSDEVKDEPVLEQENPKGIVSKHLQGTKTKSTIGKIIDKGKLYNNALAVELKIKGKTVIATIASSSNNSQSKGKYGLAHSEIGKNVTLKNVPASEWNPDGKIINPATGKPYITDRVDIYNSKKEKIGVLQETNFKEERLKHEEEKKAKVETEKANAEKTKTSLDEAKERAAESEKEKDKTPDEIIAEKEAKQKENAKKIDDIKKPIKEYGESVASFAKRNKEYFRARKEAKKDNGETKQGILNINDDDVLEGLWAIIEAVANGVTTFKKGLANLRKGIKDKNLSDEQAFDLEEEFYHQIAETEKEKNRIENDKSLTEEQKKEAVDKSVENLTERLKEGFAGMNTGDGDQRFNQLKAKVSSLYKGIPEFKNNTEIEEMLMNVAKDETLSISKDFKKGIQALFNQGREQNNEKKVQLAVRLKGLEEEQLIALFAIFESSDTHAFIETRSEFNDATGKLVSNIFITNSNLEQKLVDDVLAYMETKNISQAEYLSKKATLQLKKPSLEADGKYLESLTGIPFEMWEIFAKNIGTNKDTPLASFVSRGAGGKGLATKEEFIDNLINTKGFGKGSPLNTIAYKAPFELKLAYAKSKFNNVEWNNKSAAELRTHLTGRVNEVSNPKFTAPKSFYKDNLWVNLFKGKESPQVVYINGASNVKLDNKAASGTMSEEDVKMMLVENFFSRELKDGMYLQNIGQFGDKDKMAFVKAKKYSLEEAEKLYREILSKEGRTKAEVDAFVKSIYADAKSFLGPKVELLEHANLFAMNYALNYHEINNFINGNQKQYVKDKPAYVDIIKRGGSTASPGIVLNKYVKGGVGEKHRVGVFNKPKYKAGDESLSLIDGQEYVTRGWSDKVKKSSGGLFHTIIKAITSTTNDSGDRLLLKSGAIIIDDLAKEYPNSIYAEMFEHMKENKLDRLTTLDAAKYMGGQEAYDFFDKEGNVIPKDKRKKYSDKNTIEVSTDNYLVQQDLVNDGKPKESTVPIQRQKNMMHSKEAIEITDLYNKIAVKTIAKVKSNLLSLNPSQWRTYLMKELNIEQDVIDETISNAVNDMAEDEIIEMQDADNIKKLIANNVSLHHPHIHKWINSFVANLVTKQALGRKTNKSLLVEAGYIKSKDFELKEYRKVGDKVYLPECAVSEATGLRGPKTFASQKEAIKHVTENKESYADMFNVKGELKEHEIEDGTVPGEYVFVTRIPGDNMHSHTLARVKYLLPASMGNVIITDNQTQRIAGSDFDGDQRTVEMLFKDKDNKHKEGAESSKGLANKAFVLDAEWFYDTNNFDTAIAPIYDNYFNPQLANLDKERPMATDSPLTFVESRKKNGVGLAVVGTMTNMQAVYDFLRKHKSVLKDKEFKFPSIKLGSKTVIGQSKFKEFKDSSDIKNIIGNLLNHALDNVKNPRIERLGLNEVTVKMYTGALMLGADTDSVVAFFNHPIVKEYIQEVRKSKSVNSKEEAKDAFAKVAGKILGKDITDFKQIKTVYDKLKSLSDEEITKEEFNNDKSLVVLEKLRQLNKMSKNFDTVLTVIKANENAPKTWADYTHAKVSLNTVELNDLDYIDTSEFKGSSFIKAAQESLRLARELVVRTSPEQTKLGQSLFNRITNNGEVKLYKNDLNAFSGAANSLMLNISRKRERPFKAWSKELTVKVTALKGVDKFPELLSMLEVDKKGKLQILENYKRNEIPQKKIDEFQKKLKEFLKSENPKEVQFAKDLIDYNVFEHNLSSSYSRGSYASILPLEVHKEIGKEIDAEFKQWETSGYTLEQEAKLINSILRNNPSLDINANFENRKAKVKGKLYEPFLDTNHELVISEVGVEAFKNIKNNTKNVVAVTKKNFPELYNNVRVGETVLIKHGGESVAVKVTAFETDEQGEKTTIKFKLSEIKDTQKDTQQQKSTDQYHPIEVINDIIATLKKAIPGATVVYDYSLDASGQLEADGKTIRINPLRAGKDTPIHEFGHILIDAMGGVKNKLIAQGIKQLKGTDLWNKTKKAYPELDEEMLGKEVLAEAIGREGKGLFKEKTEQSKFMSWLSGLFYFIKAKLGIEKNVAKNLANQLLSKKDLKLATIATGQIQKQTQAEIDADIKADAESQEEADKFASQLEDIEKNKAKDWIEYAKRDGYPVAEFKAKFNAYEKIKSDPASSEESKENAINVIASLKEVQRVYQEKYQEYLEDIESIKNFYSKDSLKSMGAYQLKAHYHHFKKMDDLATKEIVDDILEVIGRRLFDDQVQSLRDAGHNMDDVKSKDINKADIMMKAVSDFTHEFPEMQKFAKEWSKAHEDMLSERQRQKKEILDAAQNVIKEYNKTHGITDQAKQYVNPFQSNAKYWTFMNVKGKMISSSDTEYKSLTTAQKALVDTMNKVKKSYKDQLSSNVDIQEFVKVEQSFGDIQQKGKGILSSYLNYISIDSTEIDAATVNYKGQDISFAMAKARIADDLKNKKISKVSAIAQTVLTKRKAKADVKKNKKGAEFKIDKNGNLVSKFNKKWASDKAYSEDYVRAMMEFVDEMSFVKHMKDVMPAVEAIERLASEKDENGNDVKPNLKEYIKIFKKGMILREDQDFLGDNTKKIFKFFRAMTHLRIMAFNAPAGLFNALIGKYNQFRGDSAEHMKEGEVRYWKHFKKSQAIAQKYKAVSLEENTNPSSGVGTLFHNLAFGMTKMGENYIQVAAVVGQMTKDEWDAHNDDGSLKSEAIEQKDVIEENMGKYKKKVRDIQGKYADEDKRNFSHFELYRAIGQFKIWIPDALRDRFSGEYIDMYGEKRQGTLNSLVKYGIADMWKDVRTKEFYTSKDHKHVLLRRNMRSAITVAVLLAVYLGASDDDDDKDASETLMKAINDMTLIFNMSSAQFMASTPMALQGTVVSFLKAFESAYKLQQYKGRGKYGEEGDYKAPGMVKGLLPFNKVTDIPNYFDNDNE